LDFFGGRLEGVRKGNGGDFLGLRDWSEDYGLRICIWWEIYCRRTDRAVDWGRGDFGPLGLCGWWREGAWASALNAGR